MSSELTNQCIDALCHCGCEVVRATITALETGAMVPQVKDLSETERMQVLNELKAIMAVYDHQDGGFGLGD